MRSVRLLIPIALILVFCGSKEPLKKRAPDLPVIEETKINVFWLAGVSEVRIPLTFSTGQMPLIHCQINDKPATLGLDTGSTLNCIYENRMKHFGLRVIGQGYDSNTAAGVSRAAHASSHTLLLPQGLRIEMSSSAILPTPGPGFYSGDGLVGAACMRALRATIDLDRNELVLKPGTPGQKRL